MCVGIYFGSCGSALKLWGPMPFELGCKGGDWPRVILGFGVPYFNTFFLNGTIMK